MTSPGHHNQHESNVDLLIVGAGPSGSTAATMLRLTRIRHMLQQNGGKMKTRVPRLPILLGFILVSARPAMPCSIGTPPSPVTMVAGADLIVRATAMAYSVAPVVGSGGTSGVPESRIRFRIEAVLKGTITSSEIILPGYLSNQDDWNDLPVPYIRLRPSGRNGSCFANTYRQGGQFLLMLKPSSWLPQGSPFGSNTPYTVNWYALGAVNEQLHSTDDPWIKWVEGEFGNSHPFQP